MNALIALLELLIILGTWVFVARRASRFYRAQHWSSLISLLAGIAGGGLVALAVAFLLIGFRTDGPSGTGMVTSGLVILAMAYLVRMMALKQKKALPVVAGLGWWKSTKRQLVEAWNTAQREVELKNSEKANRQSSEFALASFSYVDGDGVWTERTVTDLAGYSDAGRQYVQGFCVDRGDVRTFRLDRIKGSVSVQPGGQQLSPAEFFSKLPYPNRRS